MYKSEQDSCPEGSVLCKIQIETKKPPFIKNDAKHIFEIRLS